MAIIPVIKLQDAENAEPLAQSLITEADVVNLLKGDGSMKVMISFILTFDFSFREGKKRIYSSR